MNIKISTYGSDKTGLVYGYLFSPDKKGLPIESDDAKEWIRRKLIDKTKSSEFLWLHFNLTNIATEDWLKQNLELSESFYEAIKIGSRSTRIDYSDNTLIAVINDLLYDFSFNASDISTIFLSVSHNLVISARSKPLRSIEKLRASVNAGELFDSTTELLAHLLRDQADIVVEIVRETTTRVDEIEDKILAGTLGTKRADLGAIRRMLVRIQRLLAPEPAALFRLLHYPPEWMTESDVRELRQSSEEFSAVINDMGGLHERIKLLQEEIAALVNEQNNRSLLYLTIVTVLALPINIAAGLFGMNVGGIPYENNPSGFWIITAQLAFVTILAVWIIFNKVRE